MPQRRPKRVINTSALGEPSRRGHSDCAATSRKPPVSNVQERFPGLFDFPDRCSPYEFTVGCEAYAAEDGFPEVLNLGAYFAAAPDERRQAATGKSMFATEFERLRGDISTASLPPPPHPEPATADTYDQIEQENCRRIKQMDPDDIKRALQEIYDRIDPATIEFLKRRGATEKKSKPTASLFKQRAQKNEAAAPTKSAADDSATASIIRNLEVISDGGLDAQQLSEFSRLAMDPMHMDFAAKYMRAVVPSQERNLVRLFEKLRVTRTPNDDTLVEMARGQMDAICDLYLEEFVSDQGKKERRFARDVNPVVNSAWSLVPIRRVVDAVQSSRTPSDDDREIVELSLLWTVLLLRQQPTYFNLVHSAPGDVYCRLAELYLLGPKIFASNVVEQCVSVITSEYLLPKADKDQLWLKLIKSTAGLDAFLPFYEDLMKRFLEFSLGDARFSLLLLMGAYMNAALADALTMRLLLWSTAADVVRQMSIGVEAAKMLLDHAERQTGEQTRIYATQFGDQLHALLVAQRAAIQSGLVTAERNPTVWKLAQLQLQSAAALGFESATPTVANS